MENEVWKIMKEHSNYEVSNLGKIKNKTTGRIRKTSINNKGYEQFIVYIDKKPKTFYVHRVVANNFLENLNNLPEVNHKDKNKLNNRVDNLEWCDGCYNLHYGTRIERIINKKKPLYIKIIQKDKNKNIIKIWENIDEIVCNNNYHRSNIYKCCQGKLKTAYGYIWNYL
jgi:hypothetical protein